MRPEREDRLDEVATPAEPDEVEAETVTDVQRPRFRLDARDAGLGAETGEAHELALDLNYPEALVLGGRGCDVVCRVSTRVPPARDRSTSASTRARTCIQSVNHALVDDIAVRPPGRSTT